ncbi:hypothetical protein C8F01DRAFT_39891 [Mycena amicta]|nr:hypothetical protein C8F01DRAFT_39891 [Mycena amicta]
MDTRLPLFHFAAWCCSARRMWEAYGVALDDPERDVELRHRDGILIAGGRGRSQGMMPNGTWMTGYSPSNFAVRATVRDTGWKDVLARAKW